jgi:hypothetical protein
MYVPIGLLALLCKQSALWNTNSSYQVKMNSDKGIQEAREGWGETGSKPMAWEKNVSPTSESKSSVFDSCANCHQKVGLEEVSIFEQRSTFWREECRVNLKLSFLNLSKICLNLSKTFRLFAETKLAETDYNWGHRHDHGFRRFSPNFGEKMAFFKKPMFWSVFQPTTQL